MSTGFVTEGVTTVPGPVTPAPVTLTARGRKMVTVCDPVTGTPFGHGPNPYPLRTVDDHFGRPSVLLQGPDGFDDLRGVIVPQPPNNFGPKKAAADAVEIAAAAGGAAIEGAKGLVSGITGAASMVATVVSFAATVFSSGPPSPRDPKTHSLSYEDTSSDDDQ